MALQNYKGGDKAAPDWAIQEDGHRLGRISGDWEDALHSAVPNHSERNWNHGAQMTQAAGTTDGDIDSQEEVDAVADWLKNNKPGEEPSAPAPPVEEVIADPSNKVVEAKERIKAFEDDRWSGKHADDMFHDSMDTTTDTPVNPNKYELDLSNQAKQSLLTSTATPEPAAAQGSDVGQKFKDEYMNSVMRSSSRNDTNTLPGNANTQPGTVQGDTKFL